MFEGSTTILEASSRLGVVRMKIPTYETDSLKDPNEIVDVISLQIGKESLPFSHYRIRVKIDGKYYVGHLEMSE